MRNLAYHIPRILLGLLFTLAGGSIVFLIGHELLGCCCFGL